MKLEDLTTGTRVRGLLPDGVATVKSAQWFGDHGVEIIFTDAHGTLQQRIGYREDEPSIELVQGGRPRSFDGDGHLLRLVSEAQRIHLACLFDPYLPITLPHQISAPTTIIGSSTLLVKPEVAKAQIEEDQKPKCPACKALEPDWQVAKRICMKCGYGYKRPQKCPKCGAAEPSRNVAASQCDGCGYKEKTPTNRPPPLFVGSVKLDETRVGRDAGRVADEVLSHLITLRGANAKVTLEIEVEVAEGIGDDVVRVVTENARTLKFESASFENE